MTPPTPLQSSGSVSTGDLPSTPDWEADPALAAFKNIGAPAAAGGDKKKRKSKSDKIEPKPEGEGSSFKFKVRASCGRRLDSTVVSASSSLVLLSSLEFSDTQSL